MRVFLIRHGETEHNVAGLLAGVTDSLLTNHGLIQAQRLGSHLIKTRCLQFSQVFSSDLKRAFRTANELCLSQRAEHPNLPIAPTQLTLLRERDLGSFELLSWNRSKDVRQNDPSPDDPDFQPKETAAATKLRADTFLDDSLLPLLALDDESEQVVAVVSHGIFLSALWRALLLRFRPQSVSFHPDALPPGSRKPLECLGGWSNTGYLELLLKEAVPNTGGKSSVQSEADLIQPNLLLDANLMIMAVNSKNHLASLKRMRGGIGSSTSDDKQKRVDSFFKKAKIDKTPQVTTKDEITSSSPPLKVRRRHPPSSSS